MHDRAASLLIFYSLLYGIVYRFVHIPLNALGWLCQPLPIIAGSAYESEVAPRSGIPSGFVIYNYCHVRFCRNNWRKLLYLTRKSFSFAAIQMLIIPSFIMESALRHINFERLIGSHSRHLVEIAMHRNNFKTKVSSIGNSERNRKWLSIF